MAQNLLFGIGEPVFVREMQDNIPAEKTIAIMKALGVKCLREWTYLTTVLKDPKTVDEVAAKRQQEIFRMAGDAGMTVVGMSHMWFLPDPIRKGGCSVPDRDLTEGSLYMRFLNMLEESWYTMAGRFPEVKYWEMGNEWNHNPFLHPLTYGESGLADVFDMRTKADISTDMMYWSAKGIKRANPNAKTVMASPAPVDEKGKPSVKAMAGYLEMIYKNIFSGAYPTKDTDDFFDVLAWHPYYFSNDPGDYAWTPLGPDERWVAENDEIYGVARKYGDGDKKVMFTELGYTDLGSPEADKKQGEWYESIFRICAERMPYVQTVHLFRLFEDFRADRERKSADWGGIAEVYFGMFREPENGFSPKEKALAYKRAAGGTGDLHAFI